MDLSLNSAIVKAQNLVGDVEGANRYSVIKTFQRVGYNVSEAASGEEALERFSVTHAFLDIHLPMVMS